MKDLADFAIKYVSDLSVTYGDVRIVKQRFEDLKISNGKVDELRLKINYGFGIRVIANGSWGFSSSNVVSKDEIKRIGNNALAIAKASATTKKKDVKLIEIKSVEDSWETKVKKDPFKVTLEEKLGTLQETVKLAREVDPKVKVVNAYYKGVEEEKVFNNTEGSKIRGLVRWCGGGFDVNTSSNGVTRRRSYPSSFRGSFSTQGYEFFKNLDLIGKVEEYTREGVKLLSAKTLDPGKMDLLLEGDQLALQIHESCGHPTELDRALGTEADYAGTSFLTPDMLGKFQYGSDIVNLTADATVPGGLGTHNYDDEGVSATKTPLIKNGIFVGYQSSRETAAEIGLKKSSGGMRADSPLAIPLVRMTNINLEPGTWTRDEILEDTKNGILMLTNVSWSIDDRRLNFQFGTEIGYLIKNGELTEMVAIPSYTGITYEFWRSCDAISRDNWEMHGTPNCGKGVPPQIMYVGHGSSTARFRNVRVGISG